MNTKKHSPPGVYVEVKNLKRNTLTAYGPFASIDAASRARFFWYESEQFEDFRRNNERALFSYGVYDAGEIDSVAAEPGAHGYRAYYVKPAAALKADPRWAVYDSTTPGFSAEYFTDFFKRVFNRAPEQ